MGVDTYDSVHAIVLWRDPTDARAELIAQFAIGWIDPDRSSAMSDQRYILVGSDGRLECDQKNRGLRLVTSGGGVEDVNPSIFPNICPAAETTCRFAGYGYQSIERFLLDVVDLREGRVAPAISRASGLRFAAR